MRCVIDEQIVGCTVLKERQVQVVSLIGLLNKEKRTECLVSYTENIIDQKGKTKYKLYKAEWISKDNVIDDKAL